MDFMELKLYMRVDYDDDDDIIQLMLNAVLDEMEELIPKFERSEPTNRQKILICTYVKDLYDNRDRMTVSKENVRYAVSSMMLKERLK